MSNYEIGTPITMALEGFGTTMVPSTGSNPRLASALEATGHDVSMVVSTPSSTPSFAPQAPGLSAPKMGA